MKPNYKKVSHYDTGQPWDKNSQQYVAKNNKKAKEKKEPVLEAEWDSYMDNAVYGWVAADYKISNKKKGKPHTPVVILKAVATHPDIALPSDVETRYFGDQKYVIREHTVPDKNESLWSYGYGSGIAFYYDLALGRLVAYPTPQKPLRERVQEFLAQAAPVVEESLLILPESIQKERENERHVSQITEFIEAEVKERLEPLRRDRDFFRNQQHEWRKRCDDMSAITIAQQDEITILREQVAQLQARRTVIEACTVTSGSYRRFRVED